MSQRPLRPAQADATDALAFLLRCDGDDRLALDLAAPLALFRAADIGFVDLDGATQPIAPGPHHGPAQLVQPGPGGLVMKPGAVARGRDMIERPLCHAPIRVELPCRLQNCRPATVDHPIGALGIPAIEIDAEPTTYPRAIRAALYDRRNELLGSPSSSGQTHFVRSNSA